MPARVTKSGKFVQRIPRSLHEKLARLAEREGVSLNTLVTSILSEAVSARLKPRGTNRTVRRTPETSAETP